jgi:site-specific DNA recombinase
MARLSHAAARSSLSAPRATIRSEIDRLVDAIAKGHGEPAVLGPRSSVLHEERKHVEMELNVEPAVSDTISLHPGVLARYEQQLVQFQEALSKAYQCRGF